jgi:hypothetical protein
MARLDPKDSFTPTVIMEFGEENVIVVKDAKGGQPIRRWYKKWQPAGGAKPDVVGESKTKGTTSPKDRSNRTNERAKRRSSKRPPKPQSNGDLYDRMMDRVNAAIKGQKIETITFVWMQGESDSKIDGEVYAASLIGLKAQLASDLGRHDINFVIGRLSDHGTVSKRFPHWDLVRKAQVAVAKADVRAAWVDTDDLNTGIGIKGKPVRDDLHYSKEGFKILGQRIADTAITLIRKTGK